MAVSNYTYLKLKMSGPKGVITIGPSYEHAYEYDMECVKHEEAVLESATLVADLDSLAKEIPDPKRHTSNFEPRERRQARTPRPHQLGREGVESQSHPQSQIGRSAR
jgi:hypothetical protein